MGGFISASHRHDSGRRHTKIVATLGPASNTPEIISQLIRAGMNIVRLNFSHGTHDEHRQLLEMVREEAKKLGQHIGVFQDLCGPKVRIGELEGGEFPLQEGAAIELRSFDGTLGKPGVLFVEAFDPTQVMKPGERALLADGQVELLAEKVSSNAVHCKILSGGILRSRSGIAVPESRLNLPCLTEKDIKDLAWGVENDIDYVALSFVRAAKDIVELRDRIAASGKNIPIIAKIERAKALDNISEIVANADAVMVARGDLGLELPIEEVPGAQKLIIEESNFHGTPVITATQMLRTMIREQRPTRAEVSDVCTAVRDGTDAVMLSDETAIGKHPIQAVGVLDKICLAAENEFFKDSLNLTQRSTEKQTAADAICYAACNAAQKVGASAILICTESGHTSRLVAKYRPRQPLYGITSAPRSLARMALVWGIDPILISLAESADAEDEISEALAAARDQCGLKPGSRVVVTAGLRSKRSGTTNLLQIREIPRVY